MLIQSLSTNQGSPSSSVKVRNNAPLEIELLDFIVHWILLRIVFMTDWFSQHGIEFAAFVLTLVVTVVGWVVEHKSSKEQNREREDDIRLLRKQLDSLQRQAATLEEQTAMQRRRSRQAAVLRRGM
mgnify:CR=1 FL=1